MKLLIRISSEDEVDGMPLVDHQTRRVVRPTPAVPIPPRAAPPAAARSVAANASTSTSMDVPQGPVMDKVVVKKSALLSMKRQMAALIHGELPAGETGARDTPVSLSRFLTKVPYQGSLSSSHHQ